MKLFCDLEITDPQCIKTLELVLTLCIFIVWLFWKSDLLGSV